VKRKPRPFDRGKRKAPLIAALVAYGNYFLPGISFDTADLDFVRPSARRITGNVGGDDGRTTDIFFPITSIAKRSLNAG